MTPLIGLITQVATSYERRAGVLITEDMTIAVLCFGGGPVAINRTNMARMRLLFVWQTTAQSLLTGTRRASKNTTTATWEMSSLTWLTFNF